MSDNNCCNVELTLSESPIVMLDALGSSYIGELPTMSTVQKGGAKVGAGLEVDSDEFLNIAPSGVVSSMIDNAAVTTSKLADGAVTADKIDPDVLENLGATIAYSGSGESVTADNASYLASLTVDGKAVQDGTPTPSNPVEVQVVQGVNLLHNNVSSQTLNGVTFTVHDDGTITVKGTATGNAYIDIGRNVLTLPAGTYVSSGAVGTGVTHVMYANNPVTFIRNGFGTFTLDSETSIFYRFGVASGDTADYTLYPQIEVGSTATPYIPYGSIGLKVGSTITPIPLGGNVLASLPDGTKDVLTVDSVGHVVLEKHVANIVYDGSSDENWELYNVANGTSFYIAQNPRATGKQTNMLNKAISNRFTVVANGGASVFYVGNMYFDNSWNIDVLPDGITSVVDFRTWLASNNVNICYEQSTETIDLGYINIPAVPDGATISITAQVTPTISASWWARISAAIGEAFDAVRARLQAIEAAIAELATA